jgi:two-component system cell cycle sensor histidine kinase/response regulator CckA
MLLSEPEASYAHEELSEIKRAGERAAELTHQLLAFSRKQVLELKTIDLNQTVAGALRLVRRMVGEKVRFLPGADLQLARLDPNQLVQVLLNLVANARDAMPEGGTLSIETANFMADAAYACDHLRVSPGSYVMLAVTDTGTGMDRCRRGADPESVGAAPDQKVPSGTETILVVDDDDHVRGVARAILVKQGYTVLTASSGRGALAQAPRHAKLDLLVTDVIMPDMHGPSLARQLRETHPALKVLFISGYADSAVVHQALLEPNSRYLQKPLTMSTFARRVRVILDEAGLRDAEPPIS